MKKLHELSMKEYHKLVEAGWDVRDADSSDCTDTYGNRLDTWESCDAVDELPSDAHDELFGTTSELTYERILWKENTTPAEYASSNLSSGDRPHMLAWLESQGVSV